MKAHLISTNDNKVTVKQCSSSSKIDGFKADLVVLMTNYEGTQLDKREVDAYRACIDRNKIKGHIEDHIITITRLVSDKLISLGMYPNTSDFKLC